MEIFGVLVVGAIIFFVFILPRFGNADFWKLAAKHPDESWEFFNNHPDWFVGSPPTISDYCGPYKALNPHTQTFVNVYCRNLYVAEQSQKEFISKHR